eukprot:9102716-Ditylum_brightwellii.AAC.1
METTATWIPFTAIPAAKNPAPSTRRTAEQIFSSPPNPQKRFNNYNYCWSHDCDIPDWHTSGT